MSQNLNKKFRVIMDQEDTSELTQALRDADEKDTLATLYFYRNDDESIWTEKI